MPNCRNCGARLNKWDNDVCPICGIKNPLEGVTSDTVEITRFGLQADGTNLSQPKTRKKTMIWFMTIGWTGAAYFYLNKKKTAFIWLLINLAIIGGLGSVFAFATPMPIIVGYLIGLGIAYLVNVVMGLYYFFAHDLKDGDGEFIL